MKPKFPQGCIYKRARSPYWWMKIIPYRRAKPVYESTKRRRRDHAEAFLRERLKDFTMDLGSTDPARVTFDELAEDLRTDYRIRGRKSLSKLDNSLCHLEKVFAGMRVMDIGTARIKRYSQSIPSFR